MLLMPTGVIIMSKPKRKPEPPREDPKHDPKDDPKHDPKLDLQGQAQGQLQGQAQGQAQGQYQTAVQSVDTKVDNDNKNENSNENKNENKNEIDNKVDNKVENSVDNTVDNKIENHVENKVEVAVDVNIDLDLKGDFGELGRDDDIIDIDEIKDIYGSVVMTDVVDQKMDDGNMFNIDQVNNLVDIDFLHSAEVKNDAKFDASDLKAEGGDAKVDAKFDIKMEDGNTLGDLLTTTADGIASVEAFTQNIVMGANIQFNQIEITAAGDDLDLEVV
jgi:hypothetical protein